MSINNLFSDTVLSANSSKPIRTVNGVTVGKISRNDASRYTATVGLWSKKYTVDDQESIAAAMTAVKALIRAHFINWRR